MPYFYDVGEVAEQGRAAMYEATKMFRLIKSEGINDSTRGRLNIIERELRCATARVAHLRERTAAQECAAEATEMAAMSPAEFVREFGPGIE